MIDFKTKSIEKDHLTFQLYNSYSSKKTRKVRRNSALIPSLLYLSFGAWSYFQEKISMSVAFIVLAILWYWLYPKRLKTKYKKHFTTHIKEKLADEIGEESIVSLHRNKIKIDSNYGISELDVSFIVRLIEFQNIFVIMTKGSKGILINKSINEESLRGELISWAESLGIEYKNELDWKWK